MAENNSVSSLIIAISGIMGYHAMSSVLGIVYPIHVCLQMRFCMLHFLQWYWRNTIVFIAGRTDLKRIITVSDVEVTKRVAYQ